MAASSGKMVGVSDDSSSEDDADLEKLREAVWATQCVKTTDGESNGKKSQRVIVSNHEHDGNELQVTPEFRLHVAKKLGHLLDSSISEMPAETAGKGWTESAKCDDDDEGFRLFGTSIPGQEVDDTPPPVRRRPIPSSSGSDSEMESRLREAAVSIADLLPPASLPSPFREAQGHTGDVKEDQTQEQGQGAETPAGKKRKKKKKKPPQGENEDVAGTLGKRREEEEEETLLPKKTKKRKCHSEESGGQVRGLDSAGPAASNAQSNGEPGNPEEEHVPMKVKRKKKKKHKATGENG